MADLCVAEAKARGLDVDAVVCSDDVPAGRPEPLMILENMRQLEISDTACVVNVDDTTAGVEAGRRADCWSIGVALSGNEVGLDAAAFAALPAKETARLGATVAKRLFGAGADAVIGSVARLPAALDAIDQRIAQGHQPSDTTWRPIFI
jgi:phosphonoacetaldehyde hydrolase